MQCCIDQHTAVTKHLHAGGLQLAKLVGSYPYYLHGDGVGSTRVVSIRTVTIKFSSNEAFHGTSFARFGISHNFVG